MAIKIAVANMVGFTVEGQEQDPDGNPADFSVKFIAKRLKQKELDAVDAEVSPAITAAGTYQPITDKLATLITNWDDVRDDAGANIAYTEAGLRDLFDAHPGLNLLAWRLYKIHCGCIAKN